MLAHRHRRLRTAVVVLVTIVATGVLASGAGAATIGPAGMAFYTPPSPLPSGPHGTLIWYRPA